MKVFLDMQISKIASKSPFLKKVLEATFHQKLESKENYGINKTEGRGITG